MHSPAEAPEAYAAYEREYIETLKAFDFRILERAVNIVRGEWQGLTWPPPGRIAQAAVAAERDERDSRPAVPAIPYFKPLPEVERRERLSVGAKMGRLARAWESEQWATISHEEAYDAVYGQEPKPGHKADMMARLYRKQCA